MLSISFIWPSIRPFINSRRLLTNTHNKTVNKGLKELSKPLKKVLQYVINERSKALNKLKSYMRDYGRLLCPMAPTKIH